MHKFCFSRYDPGTLSISFWAMYQMLLTINGQPQISFEQFKENFRKAFGRDITLDEQRWFEPALLKPELNTTFLGDAA